MINRTDDHYNFMQYNLGWATGSTMNYGAGDGTKARQIQIRVTQTNVLNPATETFAVTQTPATVATKSTNPFWQFGRKDPFPSGNGLADGAIGERTLWYGDAAYTFKTSTVQMSLGISIKTPHRKGYVGGNWCSTVYNNLWDATNVARGTATLTDNTIAKTIYDPNPVGFKMPPANAWTRFNLSGNDAGVSNINASNVSTHLSDGGYRFYTQKDGEGPTVLYQITGARANYYIGNVTNMSGYFSAMPASNTAAYRLRYDANGIAVPYTASTRDYGYSVRPITD
jgi:hypothetical protein